MKQFRLSMYMKNAFFLFVMSIFFLFFLSSCGGGGGQGVIDSNYHHGFDGLYMGFVDRAPPNEVFEEEVFQVVLDFFNAGAHNIEAGMYSVGYDETYLFAEDEVRGFFQLEGRSEFNSIGERNLQTINMRSYELSDQEEVHTVLLTATACYAYMTHAKADVCIDTDLYGLRNEQKICQGGAVGFNNGQGGPLAVTNIQTRMLPHDQEHKVKPIFTITISNEGDGEVIHVGKIDRACSSSALGRGDFNVFRVQAYLFDKQLNCRPKLDDSKKTDANALVKLNDGEKSIKCTLEEGIEKSRGNYVAPLRIDIGYGYTFTVAKEVLIRKETY